MSSEPEKVVVDDAAAAAASPEGGEKTEMSKQEQKKQAKLAKLAEEKAAKAAAKAAKDAEVAARREARLEAAKQIVITEDASLPAARKITVHEANEGATGRVKLTGWASTVMRDNIKEISAKKPAAAGAEGAEAAEAAKPKHVPGVIIDLRDGTGFPNTLKVVLQGPLAECYNGQVIAKEGTATYYGELTRNDAGVLLLVADYWELHSASCADLTQLYTADSAPDVLLNQRHLVLRESRNVYVMRLRSMIMQALREHFWAKDFFEVTPPCIVQNQVEGGSTLFPLDYFGKPAFLTQSSQLYLETAVPVLSKVFCCMPSFRAERHHTRRHLAEYTHFEGEMAFIDFNDLLSTLEDMVVDVAERLQRMAGPMLTHINPKFKVPSKPFKRMDYADAIAWLNEHKVWKDEATQTPYVFGDDIPEAPERFMTDTIGEPILLCRFPTEQKAFYMFPEPAQPEVTQSVDLLMPGVGEIVGGSMRSWDLEHLRKGFAREGITDLGVYKWYEDLRKYGSCPHGGWGLGLERYVCWILGIDHIRDVCLYPRVEGRAYP